MKDPRFGFWGDPSFLKVPLLVGRDVEVPHFVLVSRRIIRKLASLGT